MTTSRHALRLLTFLSIASLLVVAPACGSGTTTGGEGGDVSSAPSGSSNAGSGTVDGTTTPGGDATTRAPGADTMTSGGDEDAASVTPEDDAGGAEPDAEAAAAERQRTALEACRVRLGSCDASSRKPCSTAAFSRIACGTPFASSGVPSP